MSHKFTTSAAILLASLTVSHAADPVSQNQNIVPVDSSRFDWSGGYIGGQIGGAWSEGTLDFPGFVGPPAPINEMDANGFIGGVHAGYDFQVNQWILGVVGDINFTNLNDRNVIAFGPNSINSYDVGMTQSIRGRLGYLVSDSVLAYVTGGRTFAEVEYTNKYDGSSTQTVNKILDGYVVGAGIEWAATDRVSAYVEYTHSDYDENFTPSGGGFARHRFDLDIQQVTLGVSYRIN